MKNIRKFKGEIKNKSENKIHKVGIVYRKVADLFKQ